MSEQQDLGTVNDNREALFRHNDLTHPVIQALLQMELEQVSGEDE